MMLLWLIALIAILDMTIAGGACEAWFRMMLPSQGIML